MFLVFKANFLLPKRVPVKKINSEFRGKKKNKKQARENDWPLFFAEREIVLKYKITGP